MAADSPTRPVAAALADAFGLSMGDAGLLITLGSVALPLAGIAGLVWWAIRRLETPARLSLNAERPGVSRRAVHVASSETAYLMRRTSLP